MHKSLLRSIALLLVPCLLADPLLASTAGFRNSPLNSIRLSRDKISLLQEQALTQRLSDFNAALGRLPKLTKLKLRKEYLLAAATVVAGLAGGIVAMTIAPNEDPLDPHLAFIEAIRHEVDMGRRIKMTLQPDSFLLWFMTDRQRQVLERAAAVGVEQRQAPSREAIATLMAVLTYAEHNLRNRRDDHALSLGDAARELTAPARIIAAKVSGHQKMELLPLNKLNIWEVIHNTWDFDRDAMDEEVRFALVSYLDSLPLAKQQFTATGTAVDELENMIRLIDPLFVGDAAQDNRNSRAETRDRLITKQQFMAAFKTSAVMRAAERKRKNRRFVVGMLRGLWMGGYVPYPSWLMNEHRKLYALAKQSFGDLFAAYDAAGLPGPLLDFKKAGVYRQEPAALLEKLAREGEDLGLEPMIRRNISFVRTALRAHGGNWPRAVWETTGRKVSMPPLREASDETIEAAAKGSAFARTPLDVRLSPKLAEARHVPENLSLDIHGPLTPDNIVTAAARKLGVVYNHLALRMDGRVVSKKVRLTNEHEFMLEVNPMERSLPARQIGTQVTKLGVPSIPSLADIRLAVNGAGVVFGDMRPLDQAAWKTAEKFMEQHLHGVIGFEDAVRSIDLFLAGDFRKLLAAARALLDHRAYAASYPTIGAEANQFLIGMLLSYLQELEMMEQIEPADRTRYVNALKDADLPEKTAGQVLRTAEQLYRGERPKTQPGALKTVIALFGIAALWLGTTAAAPGSSFHQLLLPSLIFLGSVLAVGGMIYHLPWLLKRKSYSWTLERAA